MTADEIIERCAEIAESFMPAIQCMSVSREVEICEQIAESIRALKSGGKA